MPKVTFVSRSGAETEVEGLIGQSVMEVAWRAGVEGIVGECGGSCACATCHVYVAEPWRAAAGDPSDDESDLLELVSDRRPESRLSCQIRLRAELDGLVVETPARQG